MGTDRRWLESFSYQNIAEIEVVPNLVNASYLPTQMGGVEGLTTEGTPFVLNWAKDLSDNLTSQQLNSTAFKEQFNIRLEN